MVFTKNQALESCIWKLACELKVQILLLYCGVVASIAQQEVEIQEATSVQESENYTGADNALGLSSAGSLSRYEDRSANRLVRH